MRGREEIWELAGALERYRDALAADGSPELAVVVKGLTAMAGCLRWTLGDDVPAVREMQESLMGGPKGGNPRPKWAGKSGKPRLTMVDGGLSDEEAAILSATSERPTVRIVQATAKAAVRRTIKASRGKPKR